MEGPEHLHVDGPHLGRRRSWAVLAVVLLVVVGLAVLRFAGSTPDTSPPPTEPPTRFSSPSPQAWPVGLPPGTLFAGAAGRVDTIDTGSGALTRTSAASDPATTSLTRVAGGVLVWRAGSPGSQALSTDAPRPSPGRGALASGTSFLPGPDDLVWARSGRGAGKSTWRLVDADGRTTRSVRADGSVVGDGSGGLLSVGKQGVRPLFPRPRQSWEAGQVVATGPDGYVVRSCVESVCSFRLHQHGGGADRTLDTAVGEETSGGTLSSGNRLLAVTETVGGTSTLRVSVVATGEVKEIFSEPGRSTDDAVWLGDRWLVLVSEDELVLYDADDERVVTPDLPLSSLGPLAWTPA
jgi:hypothetical protein